MVKIIIVTMFVMFPPQLKHFQQFYEGYVPMKYKTYLKKIKRFDVWIDALSLFSFFIVQGADNYEM